MMVRGGVILLLMLVGLLTSGCAATTTAIAKRQLDVQTQMSDSVFLDPATGAGRSIFVQVRNTSDRGELDLEPAVRQAVAGRGYHIVTDPGQAQYWLQANVLQLGRTSRSAAAQTFAGGYGGTLIGGAAGAGIGRAASRDTGAVIAGGLFGAAAAAIADAFVADVTYSVVADIQISERAPSGVIVTETLRQDLPQGAAGGRILRASEVSDWKRYRTRVVSRANQVNLAFEDAAPALVAGLTRSIAGIF